MSHSATFEDAFNMLCGPKLGSGATRDVYECTLRPELVVKVETGDRRMFHNVLEMVFWDEWQLHQPVAKWLAPCEYLSPDGRILLQRRCSILYEGGPNIPAKLPAFFTDTKYGNFGMLEGRVVCVDYAGTIPQVHKQLRNVEWW